MAYSQKLLLLATACATLPACSGVSGGPISTPPLQPTPSPAPKAPTEDPDGSIGLDEYGEFATLAIENDFTTSVVDGVTVYAGTEPQDADVLFERRTSDGTYILTLPGYNRGGLFTESYNGSFDAAGWTSVSGSNSVLLDGESGDQQVWVYLQWPQGPLNTDNQLSYTSWGQWQQEYDKDAPPETISRGIFSYGIATDAAAMPKTGTATYTAQIIGESQETYSNDVYPLYVTGDVTLLFDFGEGTLSGEMNPSVCPWDCYPVGVYTFIDTVYASGSTSFSGAFAIDGVPVDSWFRGVFNGPVGEELMAIWKAPYTADFGDGEITGTMSGIWVGKGD